MMHECGHGLYEHGADPALERTPLARGASLGLHESQSRLWENLVGRSRPFWSWFYPRVQATFPTQLGDVDEETWFRSINDVRPGFIRIEADEASYNLHIILRFELEQQIMGGLDLRDLPPVWNEAMASYLGVEVPDDAHGVLQDVHWSRGGFGYFPTYSLGNVMSVQIWERLREDVGDVDEQIGQGEFATIREWLRENLHRHGRKFLPAETLERAVGATIDPEPYLAISRGSSRPHDRARLRRGRGRDRLPLRRPPRTRRRGLGALPARGARACSEPLGPSRLGARGLHCARFAACSAPTCRSRPGDRGDEG